MISQETEAEAEAPRPAVGARRFGAANETLWLSLLTMAAAVVGQALAHRLWRADLSVPFDYARGGDLNAYSSVIKSLGEQGWYLENARLGHPIGQQLYDFAFVGGDTLSLAFIRALSLLLSDYAVVTNLFYLVGFPLTALAALLVFRRLGVAAAPAVVCAVLFSLLPFHLDGGQLALFPVAYYAVPLGAYLTLALLAGVPLLARRADGGPRLGSWLSRRTLATVALCFVIALAGATYYAALTIILVSMAAGVAAARSRAWYPLASGAVVALAIGAFLMLSLAPNLLYRAEHGANPVAAKRNAAESERYAISFTQLILPQEGHRIEALGNARLRYSSRSPNRSIAGRPPIGLVGAIGFLWLLGVVLAAAAGGSAWLRARPLHGGAAAAALTCFVVGTAGGVSALIAYFISPQLRQWNRLTVFIAFFALLAAALLLQELFKWLRSRGAGSVTVAAVAAGVLVLGGLDQSTDAYVPDYATAGDSYRSDRAFVGELERQLPAGAAVFQLPYVPFPESPPLHRMNDYDLLRGYLHSNDLRWSYGAMKGRPPDWQSRAIRQPPEDFLRTLVAVGFAGVYIDRFGYPDGGRGAEARLGRVLESRPLVSADRRLAFFDLRAYSDRLARRPGDARLRRVRAAALRAD